jgi:hypothetical protein
MAEVNNDRGQYIYVGSSTKVPQGTNWRGDGWAEVERGRGQYIEVGSFSSAPMGAVWRGDGWAEVIKK